MRPHLRQGTHAKPHLQMHAVQRACLISQWLPAHTLSTGLSVLFTARQGLRAVVLVPPSPACSACGPPHLRPASPHSQHMGRLELAHRCQA